MLPAGTSRSFGGSAAHRSSAPLSTLHHASHAKRVCLARSPRFDSADQQGRGAIDLAAARQLPPVLAPHASPAAKARAAGSLGFGFSAGGLLFPYFIGVAGVLRSAELITPITPLGGASAGALIAACVQSGLPLETITAGCLALADDCRAKGTRFRLRSVLEAFLRDLLPTDAHERCNGAAYVAVTRALPPGPVGPELVSQYRSRDDLIATLLTSCHVPWWFDGTLARPYRDGVYLDGGLTNFIPTPPVRHTVKVCCFPSQRLLTTSGIEISPDSFEDDWPHDMGQMISFAFDPAPEPELLRLIEKGRRDARAWVSASGVLDVAAPTSALAAAPAAVPLIR